MSLLNRKPPPLGRVAREQRDDPSGYDAPNPGTRVYRLVERILRDLNR